tara:strand:+ start:356 stop:946 length:591 start_codon:yes stop_codon:yes gene_type:complete
MAKKKTSKLIKNEILNLKKIIKELENNNFSKLNNLNKLCEICRRAIKKNKKIIFFGNGGSAADSQHLATELSVKYKRKRKALPGIALTADNAAITAAGNDFGFKFIFSRQIEAIGNAGDIALAITTSGNSQNLIEACKVANKKKILTCCFSGNNGGKLKKFVKLPIIIPSKNTSIIQVIELLLGQILCDFLEQNVK